MNKIVRYYVKVSVLVTHFVKLLKSFKPAK